MKKAIRKIMSKLVILIAIITGASTTGHALAADSDHTNPIGKYLGEDVVQVTRVFLDQLDRCDDPDFNCEDEAKYKQEVIEELTEEIFKTLDEKWFPQFETKNAVMVGIAGAAGKKIFEMAQVAAEVAVDVHQTKKEQREMRRKRVTQAYENGYGDIFYETVKEMDI
ncbi:MAG: hypothetical protein KAG61_01215 [Bacteriovoracaceae bacterium]|nr:hypothetical protein [Bacteriovoracaceae bacterium]